MTTSTSGGCQCGAIRYTAPAVPVALYVCHCTECRKQSASAFGISYTVPRSAFDLKQGEPARWCRTTDSGHTLECFFCPECGTRLWHQSSGSRDSLNIKGGTLDEPVNLSSAVHIWTRSRLPGVRIPDGALAFEKAPENHGKA